MTVSPSVVDDSRKLLVKLVGTEGYLDQQKLAGFFRAFLLTHLKSAIAKVMKEEKIDIFEVDETGDVAYLGAVGLRMTNSYAAKVAKEEKTDSFDDWFLPSIAELERMKDIPSLGPYIQGARP